MKSHFKEIKALPEYLQPKILSAVAYINECSPDMKKAVDRINTVREHLSDKEVMWVMSLLTFEKLLDFVKDSDEFRNHVGKMKERTLQWANLNTAKVRCVILMIQRTGSADLKIIREMKQEEDQASIISMAMHVQCYAKPICLMSMAHEPCNTLVI